MGGMSNTFQMAQIQSNDYQDALRIQRRIQEQQQAGWKASSSESGVSESASGLPVAYSGTDSFTPSQQLSMYNQQASGQTVGLGYGMVPGMKLDDGSSVTYDYGVNAPLENMPSVPGVPLENMPSDLGVPLENMPSTPGVPLENMPSTPGVPLENMPSVPSVPLENMPSIPSYSSGGTSGTQYSAITQTVLQIESQKTSLLEQMKALVSSNSSNSQAQINTLMAQYQSLSQQQNSLASQSYYSQNFAGTSSVNLSSSLPSVPSSAYGDLSGAMDLSKLTSAVQSANAGTGQSSSSSYSGTQNSALIQQALQLESQKTALIQKMSATTNQDELTALMTQYQALNTQGNALSSQMYSQAFGGTLPLTLSGSTSSVAAASTAVPSVSSTSSTPTVKAAVADTDEVKGEEEESDYVDPFEPLKEDLKDGAQEIIERHEAVDAQRKTSKEEYAAGEHGLGREIVNQAWYNLKENVGNTVTAVKTTAKAAVDVAIKAPIRALSNVGKAVVEAAGETVKPTVDTIKQGIQEVKDRQTKTNAARQESRDDYAAGKHGLAKEVVNQAWNNVKENVGNVATAVKTTAKVAVQTVTAPARFLWNAAKNILGGK
jgi:hypothetical protein